MSKQAIVTINETRYIIDAFKGMEGWRYLPKVTKLILPFIFASSGGSEEEEEKALFSGEALGKIKDGEFASIAKNEDELADIDEDKTVKMLMELLSGENAEEIINLVPNLLSQVTKNGVKLNFDDEFSQNYMTMFKLVFEVLKLNYLSSFQKLDTK